MCRKVSALDHCLTNVNICSVCQQSSTAYSLLVSFFTCILLTDHHEQIWAVIGETGHWVWPFSAGHEAICPQTPKQDRWAVIAYALRFKPGLNGKWIGTWIVLEFNSAQSAYNYKSQSPNNTHGHTGLLSMSKCFKASIRVWMCVNALSI